MILAVFLWMAAASPGTPDAVPRRRDVIEIERNLIMGAILSSEGVFDSAAMNRAARVRVRHLTCTVTGADSAVCAYEADRCLADEKDSDDDGWCARTSRFVRVEPPADYSFPPGVSRNGWQLVRPAI